MAKTQNKNQKNQNQKTQTQEAPPVPQNASPETPAAAVPAVVSNQQASSQNLPSQNLPAQNLPIEVEGLPCIRSLIAGGGLARATNEFAAGLDEETGSREYDPRTMSFPVITIDHDHEFFMIGDVPVEKIEGYPIATTQVRKWWASPYSPKNPTAPDCASQNGIVPVADAKDKQAQTCAACPHDVWGSAVGGEGKACRTETLIFILNPRISETGISVLVAPPTSIKPWLGTPFSRGYWETAKLTPAPNGQPITRTQLVWTEFGLNKSEGKHCVLAPAAIRTAATVDECRAVGAYIKAQEEAIGRFAALRSSTGNDRE